MTLSFQFPAQVTCTSAARTHVLRVSVIVSIGLHLSGGLCARSNRKLYSAIFNIIFQFYSELYNVYRCNLCAAWSPTFTIGGPCRLITVASHREKYCGPDISFAVS